MRELRFRAWDGKRMAYDFLINSYSGRAGYCETSYGDSTFGYFDDDDALEVMQYTGLKDRNGKEIYEGDIAKYVTRKIWEDDFHEEIGLFFYNEEEIKFDMRRLSDGYELGNLSVSNDNNQFEVIGNIYQNPELLKN